METTLKASLRKAMEGHLKNKTEIINRLHGALNEKEPKRASLEIE